jgi:MFS family permease
MHVSVRGRELAFVALLLGMLVAQLEGTIVVAALPAIGADLGQPEAAPGVFTASLLAVTVSTPVHGALGDR